MTARQFPATPAALDAEFRERVTRMFCAPAAKFCKCGEELTVTDRELHPGECRRCNHDAKGIDA